jgi:hypothetical protein
MPNPLVFQMNRHCEKLRVLHVYAELAAGCSLSSSHISLPLARGTDENSGQPGERVAICNPAKVKTNLNTVPVITHTYIAVLLSIEQTDAEEADAYPHPSTMPCLIPEQSIFRVMHTYKASLLTRGWAIGCRIPHLY